MIQQGLSRGVSSVGIPRQPFTGFNSGSICEVCKGLTKCWGSEIRLVVSSEFWKSVEYWPAWGLHKLNGHQSWSTNNRFGSVRLLIHPGPEDNFVGYTVGIWYSHIGFFCSRLPHIIGWVGQSKFGQFANKKTACKDQPFPHTINFDRGRCCRHWEDCIHWEVFLYGYSWEVHSCVYLCNSSEHGMMPGHVLTWATCRIW